MARGFFFCAGQSPIYRTLMSPVSRAGCPLALNAPLPMSVVPGADDNKQVVWFLALSTLVPKFIHVVVFFRAATSEA